MSTRGIIEKILSQPIEKLVIERKLPPNKESLRLYREVLKFTRTFYWNNQNGENWSEVLRKSARKEFDLSRQESDALLVMKMILTTREAMQKTQEEVKAFV